MVLKCFRKINELWTLQAATKKAGRFVTEEDLSPINDAAIICVDGVIRWVGEDKNLSSKVFNELGLTQNPEEFFFKDRILIPAFVEAHTHSVFAGDRSNEFEMRNQGKTYQEIAEAGGGILNTVRATRESSKKNLISLAQKRVNRFLEQGVGTLEIKSGYGLDETNELKILQVINELKGPEIVATYLGPHAIPPDQSSQEYQQQVLNKTLAQVAHHKLASRVDIFIEKNYYDTGFARNYFVKAKELGFDISAHVEQLSRSGGTELALEFAAKSVDHVIEINDKEIEALSKSETTAVLLPAADFYLKTPYPPARKLIDSGARVAVASDFNPGSSPTQDLSFVGLLSRLEMKMNLAESLCAYTLNAAYALGLEASKGSLDTNKSCDFISLEDNLSSLFYSVGHHPVSEVWLGGEQKYKKS